MSRPAPAWLSTALWLGLFCVLALALLLGTGLLFTAVLSLVYDGGIASPANLSMGLVCGLIVWLFVAAVHLRKATLALPAPHAERFLHNAKLLLTEMGYEVNAHGPLQLSTRPRFHALLLGGGIQVALAENRAHLTGPKVCVELLRNRLRVLSHLGVVQQALREPHRFSETLIKRAELRLRVKPEDLAEVRTHVIDVLQASAEVVCEVHLLVQSNVGIPESTLDFQVKHWLDQKGIEATLHKHFVQLHRAHSTGALTLEDTV